MFLKFCFTSFITINKIRSSSPESVFSPELFTTGSFLSTDFCSSLKITDQSNQKICCTIFCEKLEDHPKIFQIGDIIRMHRVKVQPGLPTDPFMSFIVKLKMYRKLNHQYYSSTEII